MKLQAVLLSALLLTPVSVAAQQRVYTESYCYENSEEYIPGYYNGSGEYVSGYVKTNRKRVPCGYVLNQQQYIQPSQSYRSCNPSRTTLGGLLGGGIAAVISKTDAYGWSIPLGAVLGLGAAQATCN